MTLGAPLRCKEQAPLPTLLLEQELERRKETNEIERLHKSDSDSMESPELTSETTTSRPPSSSSSGNGESISTSSNRRPAVAATDAITARKSDPQTVMDCPTSTADSLSQTSKQLAKRPRRRILGWRRMRPRVGSNNGNKSIRRENLYMDEHADANSSFLSPQRLSTLSTSSISNQSKGFVHCHTRRRTTPLVVSSLICLVLIGAGFAILYLFVQAQQVTLEQEALDLVTDLGDWFRDEVEQAKLPLYSLAQFASKLDVFMNLPVQIGTAGGLESLPFVVDPFGTNDTKTNEQELSYRDVSGVCDVKALLQRYDEIAHALKESSKLDGILVNLQLAPLGVICLSHPLNNTEDFDDGLFMDNTFARGLDLFSSKATSGPAALDIVTDRLVVSDPMIVPQCTASLSSSMNKTCNPTVSTSIILRLPITIHDHDDYREGESVTGDHSYLHWDDQEHILHTPLVVHGIAYPHKWGFATAVLNWDQLLAQSNIHETFERRNMQFQLTTTRNAVQNGNYINPEADRGKQEVVYLAGTRDLEEAKKRQGYKTVSTSWRVTDQEWHISVVYPLNSKGRYRVAGPFGQIIVAFVTVVFGLFLSYLSYTILLQRELQHEMIATNYAQLIKLDTERNMTAYFAHELRNPLGAVDCALHAMPDADDSTDTYDRDEAKELLAAMRVSVRFMSTIMNNLLDVRKMEDGQMVYRNDPTSLSDLVASVHRMLSPSVKDGVDFRVNSLTVQGVNDWVLTDEHRIKQVIVNVLTNAIKYTREGSIVLSVGWESIRDGIGSHDDVDHQDTKNVGIGEVLSPPVRSGRLKRGVKAGDKNLSFTTREMVKKSGKSSWVKIAVSDTGPGIPKQDQDTMFERFVQRGGAPGTGLGLAISKNIVDGLGGSIRFVSDPEIRPGTTCLVKLPMILWEEQPIVGETDIEGDEENQYNTVDELVSDADNDGNSLEVDCPSTIHNNDEGGEVKPDLSGQKLLKEMSSLGSTASSYSVADALGSDITQGSYEPSSVDGGGSTTSNKKHKNTTEKTVSDSQVERSFSLLIVDDLPINVKMLKKRVVKMFNNCVISEAQTGEEAVELVKQRLQKLDIEDDRKRQLPYDVIVMDHYMEQAGGLMVGTDAVIAIRRMGVKSLIIGCSGNDMEGEFLQAGADLVWKKPIPSNAIIIEQISLGLDRICGSYSSNNEST